MRRRIVFILAAGLVVLLTFVFWPNPNRPFTRHVYSPVPGSVRVVSFQSNDWLAAHPEPVCYLAFTASPDDLGTVIGQGRFQPTSSDDVPGPSGPAGQRPGRSGRAGGCFADRIRRRVRSGYNGSATSGVGPNFFGSMGRARMPIFCYGASDT